MGKVIRNFCWHQNFVPKGLSPPALGLYTCIKSFEMCLKSNGKMQDWWSRDPRYESCPVHLILLLVIFFFSCFRVKGWKQRNKYRNTIFNYVFLTDYFSETKYNFSSFHFVGSCFMTAIRNSHGPQSLYLEFEPDPWLGEIYIQVIFCISGQGMTLLKQ